MFCAVFISTFNYPTSNTITYAHNIQALVLLTVQLSISEKRGNEISNKQHHKAFQELLGHHSIKTTQIYTKVSHGHMSKIKSPLDSL
ncbi:hypothetical protein DIS18_11390 [Algibacter marinivivus]|uniref:Tyr recombinase domain-containing protein n=1 Tax=Algibacter marinivivus TaxID=2100723 RepID=A0A2U2X4Z9_9FLAO|nr:hypothetical protein DIS18_11390 [Algibacter marinivivus]